MRALVTGGTGFIGSNLALHLLEQGYEVLVTGHDAEQKLAPKIKVLQPGFLGIDWEALGNLDVLFHQAAINDTTLMDKREMMRANVEATQELFTRAYKNGCKRFVFATSTAIYGNSPAPYKENEGIAPLNPYGVSKLKMEEWIMQTFLEEHEDATAIGLRYCNVYGPRENHKGKRASMIWQLAQQMVVKQPRIFKFGEQKRDYIYVKDVVKANVLAAEAKESCIVNCGSGTATTFNELIALLNKVLGTTWEPEYFDNPYEGRYQNHTECDMTMAKEKLGFVPEYKPDTGIPDYYASGFLVP